MYKVDLSQSPLKYYLVDRNNFTEITGQDMGYLVSFFYHHQRNDIQPHELWSFEPYFQQRQTAISSN